MSDDSSQFDTHADHVRVPWRRKLAYAMGSMGAPLLTDAYGKVGMFYNLKLGLNARFVGLVGGIIGFYDAFTDTAMGQISDNFRSRWGRRRPFILFGGPLCAAAFLGLYLCPTDLSQVRMFSFFLVGSVIFHTLGTATMVPYNALGTELSIDYDERTRVFTWRTFFQTGISLSLEPMWKFAHMDWGGKPLFSNPVYGFRLYVMGLSALSVIGFVWCALGTREEAATQHEKTMPILTSLKTTLTNVPFLLVTGVMVFFMLSFMTAILLAPYLNIYYVFDGDNNRAGTIMLINGILGTPLGLLSTPLIGWLGTRLGKKLGFGICLALLTLGPVSSWWLYTPAHPYWQIGVVVLIYVTVGAIGIFPFAMLADVIDADELKTGRRREGMYSGVFTFATKVVGAISVMVVFQALAWIGFDEAAAQQAPEVLYRLRLLFAFAGLGFAMLMIPLLALYPLNEERVRATRQLLEKRRAAKGLSEAIPPEDLHEEGET